MIALGQRRRPIIIARRRGCNKAAAFGGAEPNVEGAGVEGAEAGVEGAEASAASAARASAARAGVRDAADVKNLSLIYED